ncbi:hypothetical protein BKA64DRAFT_446990 [Cadophora sp. MPI-SDFR-AT-0126]|nr:hypothetical protein BKA64DRAFT_446990 [Leotiomycetes sp. MPI-SDFR-AT-0126]
MDPNIDTSLDASIDSVMAMDLVSSENKTPAPDSETMSDSTTQGTPSAISSTTIDRRRNRGGQNLTCNEPPCTNVPFSDQTCLSRHVREKHGSEMYYCPISTCKRYRKGFPRRFNLLAHKRRCHPEQASSLNELLKDSPREGTSGSRGDNRLWAKLNELKELRHEIDEEIGTLEDASRIMSDYEE